MALIPIICYPGVWYWHVTVLNKDYGITQYSSKGQSSILSVTIRINYIFQFPIYFSSLHLSKYRIIFSKTRLNPLPSNLLYSIDFKRTPSLKYVGPVMVVVPKQSSISDNCSGPSHKLVFHYTDKENKLSSPIIPQV